LSEAEYNVIVQEVKEVFIERHMSLLDTIMILTATSVEVSNTAYQIAPHEYHIIQRIWEDFQRMLPVVPKERNKIVGIA
jgi:hypothetical protein